MAESETTAFPLPLCPAPTVPLKSLGLDAMKNDMALIHNVLIRGINNIYACAPGVDTPASVRSFVGFTRTWADLLHVHHHGEETFFFPHLEPKMGKAMEVNIEQHGAIHAFGEALVQWCERVLKDPAEYKAEELRAILDKYGKPTIDHMHAELDTIDGEKLRPFFTEKEIWDIRNKWIDEEIKVSGKTTTLPFVLFHADIGAYPDWPLPKPIEFITRNVLYWFHSDWWKYASFDRNGKPQTPGK